MASRTPIWKQRQLLTVVMALAALAFWVVGLGAGWRGWILAPNDGGIVAHAQAFGFEAYIWWIPATVLTLTTMLMAIGIAIIRHLVDGPVEIVPEQETLPELEPLPEEEPVSEDDGDQGDDDGPDEPVDTSDEEPESAG